MRSRWLRRAGIVLFGLLAVTVTVWAVRIEIVPLLLDRAKSLFDISLREDLLAESDTRSVSTKLQTRLWL